MQSNRAGKPTTTRPAAFDLLLRPKEGFGEVMSATAETLRRLQTEHEERQTRVLVRLRERKRLEELLKDESFKRRVKRFEQEGFW